MQKLVIAVDYGNEYEGSSEVHYCFYHESKDAAVLELAEIVQELVKKYNDDSLKCIAWMACRPPMYRPRQTTQEKVQFQEANKKWKADEPVKSLSPYPTFTFCGHDFALEHFINGKKHDGKRGAMLPVILTLEEWFDEHCQST